MSTTIYCISGLAADERLFERISITGFQLKVLEWPPHKPVDNLVSYAYKLGEQIEEPQPILLGVSFGAMLALEIAKIKKTEKVLMVSSVLSARDLPFYYRWAGELSLMSLVPDELINQPSELLDYAFGVYEEEDKALFHDYLRKANPAYVRWALKSILSWDNDEVPLNVVQIHGTNDRVIPMPSEVHFKIADAGHMMVYNRADEVSAILNKVLHDEV